MLNPLLDISGRRARSKKKAAAWAADRLSAAAGDAVRRAGEQYLAGTYVEWANDARTAADAMRAEINRIAAV